MNVSRALIAVTLAVAAEGQPRVADSYPLYCCSGGFSKGRAIAFARDWAARQTASTKELFITSDRSDVGAQIGGHDRPMDSLVREYAAEKAKARQLAFFLSTPKGTAVDFWDGVAQAFERRVLSGVDPFSLSPGVEILYATEASGHLILWCRTSKIPPGGMGSSLLASATETFGKISIEAVWSSSPWLFEDPSFPTFLPSLFRESRPSEHLQVPRWHCSINGATERVSCP
jgi:hypothetical protein